jgi:hypothetical protein
MGAKSPMLLSLGAMSSVYFFMGVKSPIN